MKDGDTLTLGDTDEVEEELTAETVIDGVRLVEPVTDSVCVGDVLYEGVLVIDKLLEGDNVGVREGIPIVPIK